MPTLTPLRALAVALASILTLVMASAAAAAPVASLGSIVEATNLQYQHTIGPVHWINPNQSGSFDVKITASDSVDAIQRVDFPPLAGGWTSPPADSLGPSWVGRYSWVAGAGSWGSVAAVAWSTTSAFASAPFEVRADGTAPTGGSLTAPSMLTQAASVSIPVVASSDADSGVGSWQLERRVATYLYGSCATYGPWFPVGGVNPSPAVTDSTIINARCHEYRLRTTDNVGNVTYVSGVGTLLVDRSAPIASIYDDPIGPVSGPTLIEGGGDDQQSGIASVDVTWSGPGATTGNVCLGATMVGTDWSCAWDTGALTPGTYSLTLVATDVAGNGSIPFTRTIDVEAPRLLVDMNAGTTIAEGSTNTYDIVLVSQPVADVTITLTPDDQVTVDTPTRTFTPANWNVPQTVTVTAIDDAVDEDGPFTSHQGNVSMTTSSSDPVFDAITTSARFGLGDNDVAGMVVAAGAPFAVDESGPTSATFSVSLATQPIETVSIDVVDTDGQVTAAPATLTFTPADWSTAQVVTVTAIDDAIVEGAHGDAIAFTTTSVDPEYDALTIPDVSVAVADNDSSGPSGSATATFGSFIEVTGSQYQHASGSTMWFNPARTGSFTVNAAATAFPGVASVTFPTLGTGWTPSAANVDTALPYAASYAWTAGAASPGAKTITAASSGGNTGTAAFTVAADATPPAGATIVAQSTVTRDTSVPVSGTAGTDAQSGIGTWRYQRRTGTLAADTCSTFGPWLDLGGMNPAGPVSDPSLPESSCLQYQLVATDNVGNATTATQAGELRVDRGAPSGTIDAVTSPVYGTVTLGGTAFDATTHVRSVAVIVEDRYSICASAPLVNGRWSCAWTIGIREAGPANLKITVTDAAGQRTSVTQAVTIVAPPSPLGPKEEDVDRTPPVVGLARMPLVSWDPGVKVKASAYDDRPGTIEIRVEQQSAGAASARFTPWSPSFEESEIVPLEDRGETTCFRGIAIDEAGNKATSDPRCTTLPLDDMDLKASGSWSEVNNGGAWLGSWRRSTKAGSTLTTKVADPTPVLVVTKCPTCGSIKVLHGTKVVRVYTLKAKKTLARQLIALPVIANPLGAPLKIVALTKQPVMIDALIAAR